MDISFEEIGGTVVPGSAYCETSKDSDNFSLHVAISGSHDYPKEYMDFLLLESSEESIVSFYAHLTNLYSRAKSREDFTVKIRKDSQKKRRS